MARLTGLSLRTIANQAQMIRTENLLLKAAKTLQIALPLGLLPREVAWSSAQMIDDALAYQHWPWPLAELDAQQRTNIEWGVAGHCSRTALGQDGSAGLHTDPVVVLDYASLYPSVFIAHNICFSTLMRQQAHEAADAPLHHRTPNTVGPNTRVAGAVGVGDKRTWTGSAIAFVKEEAHEGLMPRLLHALLRERRAVKARIKQLKAEGADEHADLVAVLDARQLVLKLLANASYGFCGADTSHLCCKPLAEACLRWGNHYCRVASELIEAEGAAIDYGEPRWPGAHVIYANTDSVFVKLPGRSPAEAAAHGREMAEYVSNHPRLPAALTLEYERTLAPCLLDAHNRYAGAEYVSGVEPAPKLLQKGFFERGQCKYVQDTLWGALEQLLVKNSLPDALDYARGACRKLLGGEVAADVLSEGGFLRRAGQSDLLRMAGLSSERAEADDKTLRTQNCYALAIELLKASVDKEGNATRVFRLGEFVPYLAVIRTGGKREERKQFENLAEPAEVVMRSTPVDLKLLYENRVLPALFGQTAEASGKATKEAVDKPAGIGRLLTKDERREMRSGAHAQRSHDGVLTCAEGWRLFGLEAPPASGVGSGPVDRPAGGAGGGQKTIANFFGKKPAAGGGAASAAASKPPTPAKAGSNPPTPGGGAAAAAAAEVRLREQAVADLEARRYKIAAASGHADGEPLLLSNLAAPLANEKRMLEQAKAKSARLSA